MISTLFRFSDPDTLAQREDVTATSSTLSIISTTSEAAIGQLLTALFDTISSPELIVAVDDQNRIQGIVANFEWRDTHGVEGTKKAINRFHMNGLGVDYPARAMATMDYMRMNPRTSLIASLTVAMAKAQSVLELERFKIAYMMVSDDPNLEGRLIELEDGVIESHSANAVEGYDISFTQNWTVGDLYKNKRERLISYGSYV